MYLFKLIFYYRSFKAWFIFLNIYDFVNEIVEKKYSKKFSFLLITKRTTEYWYELTLIYFKFFVFLESKYYFSDFS